MSPGGNKHGLLVGAGVSTVGAIVAAAAYARPKEHLAVAHPLNGALARRVSRFEVLAGTASDGLRPDGFNNNGGETSQYNRMEDGSIRVV